MSDYMLARSKEGNEGVRYVNDYKHSSSLSLKVLTAAVTATVGEAVGLSVGLDVGLLVG